MFTGIVEELGTVVQLERRGHLSVIELSCQRAAEGVRVGDSIAVNGVCLTVVKQSDKSLRFEAMPATLQETNLHQCKTGERVNLERALRVGDRVSGHFVMGHVDCVGVVRHSSVRAGNRVFEIAYPMRFSPYVLAKGSIAVDGISLTIQEKRSNTFSVYIIPHTLTNTTLGFKGPSAYVNLEFDILAKKLA